MQGGLTIHLPPAKASREVATALVLLTHVLRLSLHQRAAKEARRQTGIHNALCCWDSVQKQAEEFRENHESRPVLISIYLGLRKTCRLKRKP